jgi:hypothetical protein
MAAIAETGMEANEGFTETQETRGGGMNERTGDEIREILRGINILVFGASLSIKQAEWVETFFTLPPSAESLRETRQVA